MPTPEALLAASMQEPAERVAEDPKVRAALVTWEPPAPLQTAGGLEPYVPDSSRPWNWERAAHLLRRVGIGPRRSEILWAYEYGRTHGITALVDALLAPSPMPNPPGSWALEPPQSLRGLSQQEVQAIQAQWRTWLGELRAWWITQMRQQGLNIRERMVLFWANHFVVEASKVQIPHYLYGLLDLFRRQALGNVKELTKAVGKTPAMLIYLDGVQSRAGNPNENYARELLELFTMGIGHYTEQDVVEAARAFTGWYIDGLEGRLNPQRFDAGTKTFLGRTGPWTADDIVEIIFEQPVTARFLCRKLYRHFVYVTPNEDIVEGLAQIMRAHQYELRPVLRALLSSAHFFEEAVMGAQIKSPVEAIVGAARALELPAGVEAFLYDACRQAGQDLLDPPDVAGWPGYRSWISTTTLPIRWRATDGLIDGRTLRGTRLSARADLLRLVRTQISQPQDAETLVRELVGWLWGLAPSVDRLRMLLEVLLQGIPAYEWGLDKPGAELRLQGLVKYLLRQPEYQLT
ncbi:MAG: DUF1800 domain-containing protein [Bacteroidetes bacterium]|nr:DUF1800 domain-containing protein [Rhodothermia bacterium]MCS7155691.1 DUF1800 domain-containing protein [Bacteroidota bacterium]MCX7906550.1 DUF1800 domain-containing protein [Bacteroidota bacterium]MDW8137169.1 DUF1800 domain-containing protein [Bacteroidota bacterium]MDW8284961.1 DUF1800 domain-containing protein [Bacteroidota bacterium]